MTKVDKCDRPEALSLGAEQEGRLPSGLSPFQLGVLRRLRQNEQHDAIAHELGLSASELRAQIRQILTRIGAHDRATLLAVLG
jgi:DNA-binding NarL/FixJ family response regulator